MDLRAFKNSEVPGLRTRFMSVSFFPIHLTSMRNTDVLQNHRCDLREKLSGPCADEFLILLNSWIPWPHTGGLNWNPALSVHCFDIPVAIKYFLF